MSNDYKLYEENTTGNNNSINTGIEQKCMECDACKMSEREEWYKNKTDNYGEKFLCNVNGEKAGIKMFEYVFPMLKDVTNRTPTEENILGRMLETVNNRKLSDNIDIYEDVYDEYSDMGEASKVLKGVPVIVKNGYKVHTDYTSEKVNVINNKRFTAYVPDDYDNTIYIFGKSGVYGYGVEDKDTIASMLQHFINERCEGVTYLRKFRVVNCGVAAISDGEIRHNMEEIDYKEGDIIVNIVLKRRCYDEKDKGCNLGGRYRDLLTVFNEKKGRKTMFIDSVPHLNSRGNNLIAHKIGADILEYIAMEENETGIIKPLERSTQKQQEKQLKEKTKHSDKRHYEKLTGAIVMNCNPFTLGHRYLIETALKEVDSLYVFVVEEDKSIFPFKDRLELVKMGTGDMENVTVLPSGRFMISSLTFPEYFKKETEKNVVIDSSLDLQLFGEKIAPKYNITIRFAGEEPNDAVTRQYNKNMKEMLPKYGIEFREIERTCTNGEVISATTVRKCLENKDYDKLKKLVPESTYNWLSDKGYIREEGE